jgi:hypothetical protein
MPRSARCLSLCFGFFLLLLPAHSQCVLPAAPSPATIDSTFDSFFMQNGPGWTGADGSYSLPLPDGTNLWYWSDSFIGTVNPTTRMRSSDLFQAHNSLTIQNQTTGSFTTVGYPKTSSYFAPTAKGDWFWVGSGLVVEPTTGTYQIEIMLTQWTPSIKFVGNSVVTMSWPDYTILSITPVALPSTTLQWGSQIMQVGSTYYVYGIKNPSSDDKTPYVAQMPSLSDLTNPSAWLYWNATKGEWLAGQTNATAMSGIKAVTPEYSVTQLTTTSGSTFYMLTGMNTLNPPYPLWDAVTTWYSCNPQGPWTKPTTVYTTPEAGANGCKEGTLVTYNPKAHPEFTDSDGILLTYNVNANDSADLVCANDYMPRFLRLSIPGVTVSH